MIDTMSAIVALVALIMIAALSALVDRQIFKKFVKAGEYGRAYKVLTLLTSVPQAAFLIVWLMFCIIHHGTEWTLSFAVTMVTVGYVREKIVFYGPGPAFRYILKGVKLA